MYTHVCIHNTYIHTYIQACMHACMHACMRACVCTHTHVYIHIHVCVKRMCLPKERGLREGSAITVSRCNAEDCMVGTGAELQLGSCSDTAAQNS